jgi:hypothetical protein
MRSWLSRLAPDHFNRLALAIIVGALGWLSVAPSAQATIIYKKVNVAIKANTSYYLDLNSDGHVDLVISASSQPTVSCCPSGGCYRYTMSGINETAASGDGAVGLAGGLPAALTAGNEIGPGQSFYEGEGILRAYRAVKCKAGFVGRWPSNAIRYLGVSIQVNGETFYGWVELKVDITLSTASATLLGYAYEDTPGTAILAGQTSAAYSSSVFDPAVPVGPEDPQIVDLFSANQSAGTILLFNPAVAIVREKLGA